MIQNDQLEEASFATKRSLPLQSGRCSSTASRHPPSPGMDTPKANKHRHEEVVEAAPRVGTRQARGMDTPKANKLRHEDVVAAAPRVGTRQARGWIPRKPTSFATKRSLQQHRG